jgi:hypothetical protein
MRVPSHRAAVLSAVISSGVDCIIQRRRRPRHDIWRTLRVGSYAFLSCYPQLEYFKALHSAFPRHSAAAVLQKTAVTQFLFAPVNISLAIAWDMALQGKCTGIRDKLSCTMAPALQEGALFWIPVNMFGFCSVPAPFQFYYTKLAAIVYKFSLLSRI